MIKEGSDPVMARIRRKTKKRGWIILIGAIIFMMFVISAVAYAVAAIAAFALSTIVLAAVIAAFIGMMFGLYRASFHYIEALNITLGDRFK